MRPLRVLLVDDEVELVTTLAERLEIRAIDARVALTGDQALKLYREERFDVVVLDVRLEGEDGIDVMEALYEIDDHVPVILMTGHTCEETSDKGLGAGAVDYIVKPVDIEVLIEKMREGVEIFGLGSGAKR